MRAVSNTPTQNNIEKLATMVSSAMAVIVVRLVKFFLYSWIFNVAWNKSIPQIFPTVGPVNYSQSMAILLVVFVVSGFVATSSKVKILN